MKHLLMILSSKELSKFGEILLFCKHFLRFFCLIVNKNRYLPKNFLLVNQWLFPVTHQRENFSLLTVLLTSWTGQWPEHFWLKRRWK